MHAFFDHAGKTLVAKQGPLTGFEIAGADRDFVPASASIDGDSVVVSSSTVPNPRYVRYGWQNAPSINLFNSTALPASPFTTEGRIPVP